MNCEDCTQSQSRLWGGYRANCPGCELRGISICPDEVVKAWLSKMSKVEGRAAAEKAGKRIKAERARDAQFVNAGKESA